MKLAIVHYHLRSGGVREVLLQESRLLAAAGVKHVLLVGDPAEGGADVPVRKVEGLDYASAGGACGAEELGRRMMRAARHALGGKPDAWHFHNHALGKNPAVPRVVAEWARRGERMLLQTHDRVELGRPQLYPAVAGFPGLHPHAPHVHHAFLNRRDLADFERAGLPRERGHWLPNPITRPSVDLPPADHEGEPLLWVPMRAIRRKNPGELLLLAAMLPGGARLAVSRAPLDAAALSNHERWAALALRLGLPLDVAVSDRLRPPDMDGRNAGSSFRDWSARSTHWLSTSVEEGFGLVFGEAMAAGRPMVGRYLEAVCADHPELGIRSGALYARLLVPADWVDRPAWRARLNTAMGAMWRAYGRECRAGDLRRAEEHVFRGGDVIDFADLPEDMQETVIGHALEREGKRSICIEAPDGTQAVLADWLGNALGQASPRPEVPEACSADAWRGRFSRILEGLEGSPGKDEGYATVCPEALLDGALQPERFRFLLAAAG
jgi:hypothetical protein